jgi:hypothetical protein
MTSPAKIRTDRRDALRSTGPRSHIGRVIAFRNARRHGLTRPVLDEPSLAPELTERTQRRNANDFKQAAFRAVTALSAEQSRSRHDRHFWQNKPDRHPSSGGASRRRIGASPRATAN